MTAAEAQPAPTILCRWCTGRIQLSDIGWLHVDGIPAYWRVEQEPALSLVEHQLTDMGKYCEHSPRAGVVKIDKPWPIEIDLDAVAREAGV